MHGVKFLLPEGDAIHNMRSCRQVYCCLLQVCYYRDKQTTNKFQIAKVTADGTTISEPFALETKWDYKVGTAMNNA